MSADVALIGFPRLQEQIATKLLAEHDIHVERVTYEEAAARLELFNFALYFWPDGVEVAVNRLKAMRQAAGDKRTPIIIVASHTGQRTASKSIGEDADDILLTPLQAHDVAQKLAKYAGIAKAKEPVSVDADFVNPFVTGVMDTMKRMAGMTCERTGFRLAPDAHLHGDFTGTVGLSGNAEGFVSMCFSKELATQLVCKMLSVSENEITEGEIRDGVGEFMNVAAGAAKAELMNTKHSFSLSLPQVFSGGSPTAAQPPENPVFVIEFEADGLPFSLSVCMRQMSP